MVNPDKEHLCTLIHAYTHHKARSFSLSPSLPLFQFRCQRLKIFHQYPGRYAKNVFFFLSAGSNLKCCQAYRGVNVDSKLDWPWYHIPLVKYLGQTFQFKFSRQLASRNFSRKFLLNIHIDGQIEIKMAWTKKFLLVLSAYFISLFELAGYFWSHPNPPNKALHPSHASPFQFHWKRC